MSRVLPILFNTDMVLAILDGRKTVTRRVVKPANPFRNKEGYCQGNGLWIDGYSKDDEPNGHIKDYSVSSCWWPKRSYIEKYAPYQPGDILYVRETWHKYKKRVGKGEGCHTAEFYGYRASIANSEDANEPWHPSIHMPKEAARIWLKVKDVRVERLQFMSWDAICNEGIMPDSNIRDEFSFRMLQNKFKNLWDSTIKKSDLDRYGWDANPWVWVIEFERCEKPEG